MSEKEKRTIENIAKILPDLPDFEKGRLLGYGERMVEEKKARDDSRKIGEARKLADKSA